MSKSCWSKKKVEVNHSRLSITLQFENYTKAGLKHDFRALFSCPRKFEEVCIRCFDHYFSFKIGMNNCLHVSICRNNFYPVIQISDVINLCNFNYPTANKSQEQISREKLGQRFSLQVKIRI